MTVAGNRTTKVEREEAEAILLATKDMNLGGGIWLRPKPGAPAGAPATLVFR